MNNVYVRGISSIKSISLTRIFLMLPLIIYGCYKNGIYLYLNHYISFFQLFRPLIIIATGALIGALVNIIYEYIIKKKRDNIISTIFSSFHVEYGVILASVSSINTNIFIFAICTFFIFLISKFFHNRINIVPIAFIFIYIITTLKSPYEFANVYELSKNFSLSYLDYLTGVCPGGLAATHIILIIVAFSGLHISNTNKSEITIYAVTSFVLSSIIYALINNQNILNIIFFNNYFYIFTFVATDSVTSCYTTNGKRLFGILVGLLTMAFYIINPILAPHISIAIVSLLNNLIDRKVGKCSSIIPKIR